MGVNKVPFSIFLDDQILHVTGLNPNDFWVTVDLVWSLDPPSAPKKKTKKK
jgi:hypothetical protein